MENRKNNILMAALIGFVVALATFPLNAENQSIVIEPSQFRAPVYMIPYDSGEESSYLAAAHGGD
jgi:hypothetical protein